MNTLMLVWPDANRHPSMLLMLRKAGYDPLPTPLPVALQQPASRRVDAILWDARGDTRACRELKLRHGCPALLIFPRVWLTHDLGGFDDVQDDFVFAPVDPAELVARLRLVMARRPPPVTRIEAGRVTIDVASRRVFVDGAARTLSLREFDLLHALARCRGEALSREQLMSQVWRDDVSPDSRTLDVHVRWLREKIERDPSHPQLLQTVRGIGYRFDA